MTQGLIGLAGQELTEVCLPLLLNAGIMGMDYHSPYPMPGSYFNGCIKYLQEHLGFKKFTSLELKRHLLKKNLTY